MKIRSQIKQTLKKKAFEEAGIPVKQISLVQVQPQTMTPVHITQETVYIKNEPQILSSIPSTSTAIIVQASPEPPNELIVSEMKDEDDDIRIGVHDTINLLTNPDEELLDSLHAPATEDDSVDSNEIKMEDVVTG